MYSKSIIPVINRKDTHRPNSNHIFDRPKLTRGTLSSKKLFLFCVPLSLLSLICFRNFVLIERRIHAHYQFSSNFDLVIIFRQFVFYSQILKISHALGFGSVFNPYQITNGGNPHNNNVLLRSKIKATSNNFNNDFGDKDVKLSKLDDLRRRGTGMMCYYYLFLFSLFTSYIFDWFLWSPRNKVLSLQQHDL